MQLESVHRRKDGSLYDVKITIQQIQSQNQQVFAAIVEDLTGRKEVERELKQRTRGNDMQAGKLARGIIKL